MECVQIRSYFWSVFSCIRTEYRKIRTRINSVFGHFTRSFGLLEKVHLYLGEGTLIQISLLVCEGELGDSQTGTAKVRIALRFGLWD